MWVLRYSVVWMGAFATIIATGLYERFDAIAYFVVCGGLALPLLVQPVFFRGKHGKAAPSIGAQHAATRRRRMPRPRDRRLERAAAAVEKPQDDRQGVHESGAPRAHIALAAIALK